MTVIDPLEPVITTERLELHHLGASEVLALYDDPDDRSAYDRCGFTNPCGVLVDEDEILLRRVTQLRRDPAVNRWLIRFIVDRQTKVAIGSTSFHGPPDDDGVLEIGLGLHDSFRHQGFGSEAVRAMWGWAIEQPEVTRLRYSVSRLNVASVRLIATMKFNLVGQQMDEVDGPEDVYELSVEEFRQISRG